MNAGAGGTIVCTALGHTSDTTKASLCLTEDYPDTKSRLFYGHTH